MLLYWFFSVNSQGMHSVTRTLAGKNRINVEFYVEFVEEPVRPLCDK